MKIRNEILLYFSITVIALSAISLIIIYIVFSEYREEEFQQQQYEKIKYTIGLVIEFKAMSEELALMLDAQDIHDFYDEKLLIYDGHKDLVFSSLDSLAILQTTKVLGQLSPSNRWVETKEGDYDLVGIYYEKNNTSYYAISKAYDAFGYSKLYFLRNVLIVIFSAISVIVIFISLYLSKVISKPITDLAEKLQRYNLVTQQSDLLEANTSSYEIQHLTQRFNDLLKRTREAFAFQKNAIQHISHELKTPVAVLVSELEKLKTYTDVEKIHQELEVQINQAKSLGEIISVFLKISKLEAGQPIEVANLRIDDLLFDSIEELKGIYPHFSFEVNYFPDDFEDSTLVINASKTLVKQAFLNLLLNAIHYSNDDKAEIKINCSLKNTLLITIRNNGEIVSEEEQGKLFEHAFRGKNSKGKTGFGLGLVLAKKIFEFYNGEISYRSSTQNSNIFEVHFKTKS